jgi:hypothetical protein
MRDRPVFDEEFVVGGSAAEDTDSAVDEDTRDG